MELLASGHLAALPKRVFGAADRLAKGESGAASEFAVIAQEIASLERWADDVVLLRPLITVTRQTQAVVRSLVDVYDVVAAALVEERLDHAQQAGEAVQVALDEASESAGKASVILERANRVLDAADPVGAWVAEAVEGNPIAAATRGKALLDAHTGRSGEASSGFAAVFYDAAVSTIGDPRAFWALVAAHLELIDGASTDLADIVSNPMFSTRAVDVSHDLWEAARRAAVAPQATTLRAESGQLLESGHLLVEQPLKFHLGTVCALTTRMTFADTQACEVSQLINIARDKSWEVSPGIGDADLRNAFAHRDFEVVGNEVSLSPQRRRRDGDPQRLLPLDQLQDRVLGLVETLAAMDLALLLAMDSAGIIIDASPLGHVLAAPLLTGLGWSDVAIADESTIVAISATAHGDVPLAAVSFAAQPFADHGGPAEPQERRLLLGLTEVNRQLGRGLRLRVSAGAGIPIDTDEFNDLLAFASMEVPQLGESLL